MPLSPLSGILPPMLTPFTVEGGVDRDAFVHNMQRWHREGVAGYVVLGSNSETVYLTEDEKLDLIGLAVDHAPASLPVIAGTGLESTKGTITLTRRAAELGAAAALLLPPSYYGGQMTDEALLRHFAAVAEASEIPVLLYNVPRYTHLPLSFGLVSKLSRHPNVVGIKDSSGDPDQLVQFQSLAGPAFQVFAGTASVWLPGLRGGVRAGIMALANCHPAGLLEVQRLHDAGLAMEAEALQACLNPLNKAVTVTYGIPGLKAAAEMMGYEPGEVRAPLLPLSIAAREAVERLVAAVPGSVGTSPTPKLLNS